MSTYYTEYTNHALRFYIRHPGRTRFYTDVDRQNYEAARSAVRRLESGEAEIVRDIYLRHDALSDSVKSVSAQRGIAQDDVYKLLARVSHIIAKERKLI